MTDIVERLRARAMRLDWATVPTHELEQAADEIELRRREIGTYVLECANLRDEIEQLRKQLKLAVFSDSEECKLINKDNERLKKALTRMQDFCTRDVCYNIARAALSQKEGE